MRKADAMMGEINAVLQRYGVGRGLGFVPDILQIGVERRPDGSVRLRYREEFSYLPAEVLGVAVENSVTFLRQAGVPDERIRRSERGVEVDLEGDPRVLQFPVLELLIQDRRVRDSIEETSRSVVGSLRSLSSVFDFAWDYSPEVEERWNATVDRLRRLIEEHPEIQREIEEITRRYNVPAPTGSG